MDVKDAGSLGGQKTVEKYGLSYMKELALKSAAIRKKKKEEKKDI